MAKIFQNRGGTLTPILDTDKFVSVENVNQTILGNKTFTGSVVVPDQTVGNYSSNAANTKFVQDTVTNLISCREETYTAPAGGVPENTNITIPSSQKYIVGSKMLEVYYNGLIEYRGDQYDEVGTVNTESGTITIKHAMEEGDKLVFRINGLCDADSVSDAVHITGTETITGTKTFTVSPNVPTVTDISDSSTKIASTKFVHDLVDGFVTCVDEVLDITTAQASGSLVTLPQGLQYIVGSNALMVSYNGAVCHHGEQFNEYGTTGQLSNQIEILFDLSVGDQLGFRIQGLNRIDDFTDVVHQSGAETITGTKTFNVSPVLPEMAMSTNDRTAASTEFVHDMVDGFMMCYDEVLTVATPVVSGGNITLPAGMQYVVGSHMLMMSYNGTVCHIGEQFNEVGTTGQNSSTIQVLFDLRVGDKLGFRLHGISEAVQIPYDVVHTSGSETISGVKSFNSSPVVPTPSLGDYSNSVVTSKWVKDVSTAAVYVSPSGDDSNSGMTAAESVRTIGRAVEIIGSIPSSDGIPMRKINIAAGTYDEEITISHNIYCIIHLLGNVVINGFLVISHGVYANITREPNATLTINCSSGVALGVVYESFMSLDFPILINASNCSCAIRCYYDSTIFAELINIVGNTVVCGIEIADGSRGYFTETINITGSSITTGIKARNFSYCHLSKGVIENNGVTSYGLVAEDYGFAYCKGNATLYGVVAAYACWDSAIQFENFTNLSINASGNNAYGLFSYIRSIIKTSTNVTNGTINISVGSSGRSCFSSVNDSTLYLESKNVVCNGTCSYATAYADYKSYLSVLKTIQFSGSVTGKRYMSNKGSMIHTNGAGANLIPGSTAGTVDSTNYAVYT